MKTPINPWIVAKICSKRSEVRILLFQPSSVLGIYANNGAAPKTKLITPHITLTRNL